MSILSILIAIFALFFIFFIIFLSIGLKIYLKLIKDDDGIKADLTVKWIAINVFTKKYPNVDEDKKISEKKTKKKKAKKSEKKEKTNKEKWDDFKRLYPLIKPNISPILDFLIVCLNSVKLQEFDTHITLGLSSFSDTAIYTGYIWAFSTVPNLSSRFNLTAEPSFTKEAINFDSDVIFKIKLLKPFVAMLKLLLRRSMINLIWNLRVLA